MGEKRLESHIMDVTYSKWPEWQTVYVKIKILTPGRCLHLLRGYIHVWKEAKICIKSDFKDIFFKLAANGQSDKAFLLTSEFSPQRVVCPYPGAIHVEKHEKMCIKSEFKEIFLQQMVEVVIAFCWHQNFDPKGLSSLASGLYICIK